MLPGLPTFHRLINLLRHVPYLASKNVYRVALFFLKAEPARIEQLFATIQKKKKKIAPCAQCGNWAEEAELCAVCADPRRERSLVCVVEEWQDLFAIERTGSFNGLFHVLGGVLSPLEGIGPDDLRIEELIERIATQEIKEVIFATNPTPEGEATVNYILAQLPQTAVMYSRLASGVPTGGSLSYMDRTTIHKALSGRRPL